MKLELVGRQPVPGEHLSPARCYLALLANPTFNLIKQINICLLFDWILAKSRDSSPFQPAIPTVLHAESESGVKMDGIQRPGAKI